MFPVAPRLPCARWRLDAAAVRRLAAAVLLASCPALAEQSPDVRYTSIHTDIEVHRDGSYVETREFTERLGSERAAHEAGQIKIPYSTSLDRFSIEAAYTLKRSGEHIDVPQNSIFVQDGSISASGLTSFQDIKTSVVVFPNLEAGDSIVLRSRLVRSKPMLARVFTFAEAFSGDFLFDDVRITVRAPLDMPLQVQNIDVPVQGPVDQDGERRWVWTYSSDKIEASEPYSVDALQRRPRVLVSSVKSYDELAAAVRAAFAGKAAVTPPVQALADRITQGARSPRDRALAIQEWVARNIRYFAVVLDVSGYVPRAAADVIATGYGDCKEHAVVLKALLAAKGIDSSVALLSTDPIYELPAVPVLAAFNHAIVYVPSLDEWLETNTPWIRYGTLSWSEYDKPALLIDSPQAMGRTPVPTPAVDAIHLDGRITIAADGSASGQDVLTARGPSGLAYNQVADSLATSDPIQFAGTALAGASFAGTGTATANRISNTADFSLTLLYELPDFTPAQREGFVRPTVPMEFLGASARQTISAVPLRKVPYICLASDESESLAIDFPAGTTVFLPQGTDVAAPHRHYVASYRLDGSTVHIQRQFTFDSAHAVCDPSDYAHSRLVQSAILDDLRNEIRYIPPTLH